MKILFLYSEVAGYFLSCAETLHKVHGAEVHIVRWPVNPEAPFQFREYEGITFYERKAYDYQSLIALCEEIDPDLVYVSGWMDKTYLKAGKWLKIKGKPVVCGLDNHWRGDIRQKIATLISPFHLQRIFTHAFVPGIFQYEFARRLGFPSENILRGMYSADVGSFHQAFLNNQEEKTEKYPHNFLYVGRFIEIKGLNELHQAFIQLDKEMEHDWTLTLIGAGDLPNTWAAHPKIQIKGFVQPEALPDLAEQTGCFILPSQKEPWGVVLHEFAGAGLPLVASDAVGAASAFLVNNYNGFSHQANNKDSLKEALKKIISASDEKLLEMGRRSNELSRQITPETWAATLSSIVKAKQTK